MGNPVNFELRELRMSKEHYTRILKEDELIICEQIREETFIRISNKFKLENKEENYENNNLETSSNLIKVSIAFSTLSLSSSITALKVIMS